MQRLLFIGAVVALMAFANPFSAPVTYLVDKSQSKLNWTAKKVTGQHNGTIDVSEGTLQLDGSILKGGSFSLDTKSITVTDLTGNGKENLTKHLKSDDFFSVEKHPTATFVITNVQDNDNGNYDVTGKLTIKGITNDISFPATVAVTGGKATAKATVKVDRTKFDIKYRSTNFFQNLGDKAIYDDFTLDVTLVANAQ